MDTLFTAQEINLLDGYTLLPIRTSEGGHKHQNAVNKSTKRGMCMTVAPDGTRSLMIRHEMHHAVLYPMATVQDAIAFNKSDCALWTSDEKNALQDLNFQVTIKPVNEYSRPQNLSKEAVATYNGVYVRKYQGGLLAAPYYHVMGAFFNEWDKTVIYLKAISSGKYSFDKLIRLYNSLTK